MAAEQAAAAWPAPPPFQSRDPPAPVDGEFTMFGVARTTGPPVAPQLEEQVYSDATEQRCDELRRLNRSLLQSFLQLTQLMARSPSQCSDKGVPPRHPRTEIAGGTAVLRPHACAPYACAVADLRTLFLNFEHLLNTFRPHEAREELIAIVKQQAEAKRQLADELDAARAEAAAGVAEGLRDPPAPPDRADPRGSSS